MTYANSQINVGGTTTFDIGRDLNIKGGVFNTRSAQGQIRGDVKIESLQDTYSYNSNQKSVGVNADIALKGAGSSVSVNGGKTNINADYKAVGEQSGIFTKDGGINLAVEGKTTLIGGAITTTKAAQQAGRINYTSLGGITTQDIENTSRYKGDALSVGLSLGNTTGKPQANMNGLGYGTDSDRQTSITRSGITGIAENSGITTDNRAEYAGILENSFDATRVNEELAAQAQITKEFGKEAPKAVGDVSSYMQLKMIDKSDIDAADKWAEGGAYRVGLHTLVGAIATGRVEGAFASGTTAVSVPAVSRYLYKQGVDETTKNALLLGLSAGIGSTIGGNTAGAANSVNQTQNNYLNHIENARLADLKKEKSKLSNSYGNCISKRCAEIRALEKLDKARDKEFNVAYDNCRKGAGCKTFYNLHVTQRQKWNASAEKLFKENRDNWVLLDDEQNIFHNFNKNGQPTKLANGKYRYKKYVHNNGQLEIIIDTQDGRIDPSDYNRIVNDLTNAGSYNYYPPTNALGHKDYDVDPYIDFGSGKGDKTDLEDRRGVPIVPGFVNTDVVFGEFPRGSKNSNSIMGDKYQNDRINKIIEKALDDFKRVEK